MRCNVNLEKEDIIWANIDSIKNYYEVNPYPENGAIFKVATGDTYVYHDGDFSLLKMDSSGLNMSLYDLNKAAIAQLTSLDNEQIWEKCRVYAKDLYDEYEDNYYMLYGKEIGYFTLFHINYDLQYSIEHIGFELEQCLKNLSSNIKSIDWNEDGTALEIWLEYNGDITCLYMFPYDSGVIECREVN